MILERGKYQSVRERVLGSKRGNTSQSYSKMEEGGRWVSICKKGGYVDLVHAHAEGTLTAAAKGEETVEFALLPTYKSSTISSLWHWTMKVLF